MSRSIKNIIIHCAATPNGEPRTIIDIDRMHQQRGFKRAPAAIPRWRAALGHSLPSIGYHYVIEVDGAVKQGRHVEEIGAHVQGSNADSIGICMIGTDRFTLAQWGALKLLIVSLQIKYAGTSVKGHRDYSPDLDGDGIIERHEWLKICPGFDVTTWLRGGLKPLPDHLVAVK